MERTEKTSFLKEVNELEPWKLETITHILPAVPVSKFT